MTTGARHPWRVHQRLEHIGVSLFDFFKKDNGHRVSDQRIDEPRTVAVRDVDSGCRVAAGLHWQPVRLVLVECHS